MRLLLIDDDLNLCKVLAYQLKKNGFDVVTANRGEDGLIEFEKQHFDLVITDVRMPDISGIGVLKRIRDKNKSVIVIMITAYGSVDSAVEACQLGADDYITKPFGQEQLLFVVEKAIRFRQLQQENVQLKQKLVDKYRFDQMVARSSKMQDVLKMAMQIANSEATVLIQGESGTGKELIAQAIHYNSSRKDKPLVTVNCPSIPENLIESELFGHVKGSFTGAIKDRKGKFEMAHGGTIFLDEIGDLKGELQAKLLRVLQTQEFERVGDSKPIKVNVRIISATNKDLLELIKENRFREDLYYRLSVVPITIPPLRDRKEEIPYLLDYFVDRYVRGKKFKIDSNVVAALQNYDWPGNVRELENVIERAIVISTNNRITVKSLPPNVIHIPEVPGGDTISIPDSGIGLEEIERQVISIALNKTNNNRSQASRFLRIPRHVLLYRMKKLGVE